MRRTGGNVGTAVHFIPSVIFQTKKEFLSNQESKQKFMSMFSPNMHQAKADADLLIVQTAVASAETDVVVGNSTDRVCQSCQYVNFRVFFKPKEDVQSCLWKPVLTTLSSSVLCGVVIPPHECLDLEKIAITRMKSED